MNTVKCPGCSVAQRADERVLCDLFWGPAASRVGFPGLAAVGFYQVQVHWYCDVSGRIVERAVGTFGSGGRVAAHQAWVNGYRPCCSRTCLEQVIQADRQRAREREAETVLRSLAEGG